MNVPDREAVYQAATIMGKIKEVDESIVAHQQTLQELEAQHTSEMADHLLDWSDDGRAMIEHGQRRLEEVRAQIAELTRLGPELCRRLQRTRGEERRRLAAHHTKLASDLMATMARLDQQIGELRGKMLRLAQEKSVAEADMPLAVNEASRLQRRGDVLEGTPEDIAQRTYDPAIAIRPDEIRRILEECRAIEARDGCKIEHIEVGAESESGLVESWRITSMKTKQELKSLKYIAQEREAKAAARQRLETSK